MDELTNPEIQSHEQQVEELNHTDKLTGIFTEPSSTFEKMSKFPPRTIDWLVPLIITIVFAILSNLLLMSNPIIKSEIMDKQVEQMEKNMQEQVDNGNMTQEQADEQIDTMRDQMEKTMGGPFIILQFVGIIIYSFIVFFVVALVYFIFSKFVFKGNGNFASAMVPVGIANYIVIIQIIVITILSLAFDKLYTGTGIASFTDADKSTFAGFLLGKLDVFTIWILAVTGIGLAKMFQSNTMGKFLIMIFGVWIAWGLITFGIAKAVPFLSFLAG